MAPPTNVTLSPANLSMAARVGCARHIEAIRLGLADRHGAAEGGWALHIEGACGELAAALATGLPWLALVNSFHGPKGDIGDGIEVRTRSRHDYDLIIRPGEPARPYVLVTGTSPHFRVHGWIYAHDVRPEWRKAHGGRPPAYFVPQAALRPLDTLPGVSQGHPNGGL